jgi:hypothetical protein
MTTEQRETVLALHAKAVAAGDKKYQDPFSDKLVSTEVKHLDRGYCCRCDCRHCPYGYQPDPD